jgi:NADH dehydrogenase
MKVLVSGATGYVGQAVVRELVAAGHTAVAAVRRGSPTAAGTLTRSAGPPGAAPATPASEEETRAQAAKLFPAACEIAIVDWDDAESLVRAASGCDGIIQAVGTVRAGAKYGSTYEKVDYGTTLALIAAGRAAGAEHFVLLSSVGASARGVAYLKWKWRAEEAVRASGIPWAIVRPSLIVGPGRTLNRVLDPLLAAAGVFSRGLQLKYRSIERNTLARVLVRGLSVPPGQVLEGKALWQTVAIA